MNKLFYITLVLLLSTVKMYSQLIRINNNSDAESLYTPQQLIENVLVSGPCAQVGNFNFQVANASSIQRSYGYFKKEPTSTFPFEEGIVLSSGYAADAGNTVNTAPMSVNNGLGNDVDAVDGDLNDVFPGVPFTNATVFEFDFTPTTDNISFRYMLLSEEYEDTFPCQYSDGFAFLLKNLTTNVITNIALVPGTTTPVSSRNIHPTITGIDGCPAQNENYFEGYNVGDTNFNGRTKVMTASAIVIPNQSYRIKLVVADAGVGGTDNQFDSAIFLEAGSFNLGADLGDAHLALTDSAVCGAEILLDANIVANTYEWYKNGVLIAGATNQTYNANLGNGMYKVKATIGVGCVAEDEISLEFVVSPTINNAIPIVYECDDDGNGTAIFNLENKDIEILVGQSAADFEVVYFLDAAHVLRVPTPASFESSGQTIHVQVRNKNSNNCVASSSFELIMTSSVAEEAANIPKIAACDDTTVGTEYDGFNSFNLEDNKTIVLNGQSDANYTLTYFTDAAYTNQIPTSDITSYTNTSTLQTIYVQMTNNNNINCYDRTSFEIEVYTNPVITSPITIRQCDDDLDGISILDLTLANESISVNHATETLTYYTSQANAEAGTNVINTADAENYTTSSTLTNPLWVRVENVNCHTVGQVNIIVSISNTTFNGKLYECDDYVDTVNDDRDGITTFDLTQVETSVINQFPIGIRPSLSVSFYHSVVDAQLQANEITNKTTYRNVGSPNTERIFIRVNNNSNLDCAGLGVDLYVDLEVEELPVANGINEMRGCDEGTAQSTFDTTGVAAIILQAQTDVTLSYYDENGVLIPTATFTPSFITKAQTITIRVTNNNTNDPDGACYDETKLKFVIDTVPVANPVTVQPLCDDLPDTADGMSVFDTSTIEATILGGTQPNTKVHYYYADGTEILPTLPEFFNTGTQTITAEVVNLINPNCTATTTIDFTIIVDNPIFEVYDQLLCKDKSPITVNIENAQDIYSYFWENDKGEQIGTDADTVEISEGGEYTVTATSNSMCTTTKIFVITASSIPQIETITIFDDLPSNRVSVLVSGAGDYEFALDAEAYEDGNEQYGHIYYDVAVGLHTIHVNDKNGCTPEVTKEIVVIRFPKVITPNGDGQNDVFYVHGGNAFKTASVIIYDRYGKIVANLTKDDSWDGTYLGKIATGSDYWFRAKFMDNTGKFYERKGHFSLKN